MPVNKQLPKMQINTYNKQLAVAAYIFVGTQEIRYIERVSAQCVAFRMPKHVVMY